jgi:hypothetical protein
MGKTDWSYVQSHIAQLGLLAGDPLGYNAAREEYYNNCQGEMAINLLLVDYGDNYNQSYGWVQNRPGAPHGRFSGIRRPAETVMFASESSWDWNLSLRYNLGNGAVWPSWGANSNCDSATAEGWTRYIHNGKSSTYTGAHYPNGPTANPNLQGIACFSFCDGHVKAMKYTQAEKCVNLPTGDVWVEHNQFYTTYYPFWVPEK